MERKFSKGEWNYRSGHVFCDEYAIALMTSVQHKVDETRMDGESWLDMYVRTNEQRIECEMEREYNAKLMAAAPEMLELLETIENDDNLIPDWLFERIKNVIKKATE